METITMECRKNTEKPLWQVFAQIGAAKFGKFFVCEQSSSEAVDKAEQLARSNGYGFALVSFQQIA